MNFCIYGGFELPRENGLVATTNDEKNHFWDEINYFPGLPEACGCYIYVLQNYPWYVGKACKQSFRSECFKDHKITYYNKAIRKYDRAAPYLYLIARKTPSGIFSKPSKNGYEDIDFLETYLIGLGINRNHDLLNKQGTKYLKEMNVPGIINTKQGQGAAKAVQEIKGILNI